MNDPRVTGPASDTSIETTPRPGVAVQFFFDFGSPNAYLAHRVIPAIERRTGVSFEYVPCLLGGIFKATNNVSPAVSMQGIKNKPEYQQREMQRFLTRHSIDDFQFNPHFPVNTLQLMRGAVFTQMSGDGTLFRRYVDEVFRYMWTTAVVDGLAPGPMKMDDPGVFRAALEASDLPADKILAGTTDPAIKRCLISYTEHAVARGAFGSPSFLIGDELFFGKDRLREVEEEILARRE